MCLLLAGALLFTAACGSKENGNENDPTSAGRYVESDITPPIDGRFTSFLSAGGAIICFSEGLKTRYESMDGGGSWNESPGPGGGTDRYRNVESQTMLQDGSLLVYIQGEGLGIVAPDGRFVPYAIDDIDKEIAEGNNISLPLIQALSGDRLVISYMTGGMIQSTQGRAPLGGSATPDENLQGDVREAAPAPAGGPGAQGEPRGGTSGGSSIMSMRPKTFMYELSTGQVIAELQVDDATAAVSDGTYLYILDSGKKVTAYNLSDGTSSGKPDLRFGGVQANEGPGPAIMRMGTAGGNLLALGSTGGLYAAQDGALLLADNDGNVSTVLESTAYSIGAPRSIVSSMFALGDGSIVVNMLVNGQANRLYKYVWDADATVNPDKILTVWSLEDNNFVRAAIAEVMKSHPDAYITYEVALGGDNAMSASDAIRTLNTRLLSGNGPDVILLDGCSTDSYADRGMLLDMSGMLDTGDVFDSLLEPYINDGKLYCLPAQFFMPMLMGSEEALADARTLDELVALVVGGNELPSGGGPGPRPFSAVDESERSALYFSDLKELCDILWLSCAPDIVNDNRLDTDALRRYLQAVKAISDKYNLTESARNAIGMSVGFSDGGAVSALSGSLVWYTMQLTHYAAFSAGNLQLMQMMMEREGSALALFPGLTPGVWQPSTVVGISADAAAPDFAVGLVQAMLSVQVQQLNYGTGLPVTRAGFIAQTDAINNLRLQFGQDAFEFDPNNLIGQLLRPSADDTVLTDMMWGTVERCCNGDIDVEGAVKEIEQNVKNYLAERS